MPRIEIDQFKALLALPPTPEIAAAAEKLAARLFSISAQSPKAERELAVSGLIELNPYYYKIGDHASASAVIAKADELSIDLESATHVDVLLRRSEYELLMWDVGAALSHTAEAMELSRISGNRRDEARAWTNYAVALQNAGLVQLADRHLAYALELLGDTEEPRLRGNVWTLRSLLGCYLDEADFNASAAACDQALRYAEACPERYRESMACISWCNRAVLELLRNDLDATRQYLANASARKNLGMSQHWLIGVIGAMLGARIHNGEAERAALDAFLASDRVPARAYVIEVYSVLAAMFTSMGDGAHASDALVRLSKERANALWVTLGTPTALDDHRSPHIPGTVSVNMLERLAVTAELRDDSTGKHCFRVGRLSLLLAKRARLPAPLIEDIEMAGRLHDIGKFVVPDTILLKPGPLSAAEMQLMRTHSSIGADLLARGTSSVLQVARQIARHHHERWDGGGYPDGLSCEKIPMSARITALADVYDALTHARSYKLAWPHKESLAYIKCMRGSQFDPELTDHFLAMMDFPASELQAFMGSLEESAVESSYFVAEERVRRARVLSA